MQSEQISKLFALQSSILESHDYASLADLIVNDSYKVIKYQLAVLFTIENNNAELISISGTLDTKDQKASKSFHQWLQHIITELFYSQIIKTSEFKDTKKVLSIRNIPDNLKQDWAQELGQELLVAKLRNELNNDNTYLILFNNQLYSDAELINFNLIIKSYSQALQFFAKTKKRSNIGRSFYTNYIRKNILWIILIAIALLFLVKLTPTVMAPAQIISEKSWLINAPVSGAIKKVHVEPNSAVVKNQLLLEYDQIDLDNTLQLKKKELKTLEAEHDQAQALGFQDKEQRGKIFKLQQDMSVKQQEISYAEQQIGMSKITAPEAGIVLFKSKDDLLGKPVKVGQTLMRLADKNEQEIEIWLNINDNINLEKDSELYYYSNKNPFKAVTAKLKYYSFEAYVTPQKKIAYRLLAKITPEFAMEDSDLIIGDQGQVKIYGPKKISLIRYIFQKPYLKIRQWYYKVG